MNLVLMYLVQHNLQTSLSCLPWQFAEILGNEVSASWQEMHAFFVGPVIVGRVSVLLFLVTLDLTR